MLTIWSWPWNVVLECAAENNIVRQLGMFSYNPGACVHTRTPPRARTHKIDCMLCPLDWKGSLFSQFSNLIPAPEG